MPDARNVDALFAVTYADAAAEGRRCVSNFDCLLQRTERHRRYDIPDGFYLWVRHAGVVLRVEQLGSGGRRHAETRGAGKRRTGAMKTLLW